MVALETPVADLATGTSTSTLDIPTPPLPSQSGHQLPFGDFFFESASQPGCTLPCWHSLIIDQSTLQNFQSVMDTDFGFDGSVDFVSNDPLNGNGLAVLGIHAEIPNHFTRSYLWDVDGATTARFYTVASFEDDTNSLQMLAFHWSIGDSSVLEVLMSPQRLIRELGVPDFILLAAGPVGTPYPPIADMKIIYQQGIVFRYISFMSEETNASGQAIGLICMDNTSVQQEGFFIFGSLIIVEPFRQGLSDLTPIQSAVANRSSPVYDLEPIEDALGITPATVTQLVNQQENACLRVEPP